MRNCTNGFLLYITFHISAQEKPVLSALVTPVIKRGTRTLIYTVRTVYMT